MKTQPEQPVRWYAARSAGDHQGLVIEEGIGRNVAVTYDVKHAPLVAAAPEMAAFTRKVADMGRLSYSNLKAADFTALVDEARSILPNIKNP